MTDLQKEQSEIVWHGICIMKCINLANLNQPLGLIYKRDKVSSFGMESVHKEQTECHYI
jgi:hypothetical protein